jgi:predicted nucleic acid-binding protein
MDAKVAGLIDSIAPLIHRLRTEIQFFISDAVVRDILNRAGE